MLDYFKVKISLCLTLIHLEILLLRRVVMTNPMVIRGIGQYLAHPPMVIAIQDGVSLGSEW